MKAQLVQADLTLSLLGWKKEKNKALALVLHELFFFSSKYLFQLTIVTVSQLQSNRNMTKGHHKNQHCSTKLTCFR